MKLPHRLYEQRCGTSLASLKIRRTVDSSVHFTRRLLLAFLLINWVILRPSMTFYRTAMTQASFAGSLSKQKMLATFWTDGEAPHQRTLTSS